MKNYFLDYNGLKYFYDKLIRRAKYSGQFTGVIKATELHLPELSLENLLVGNGSDLFIQGNVLYYKPKDGSPIAISDQSDSFITFDYFDRENDARVEDIESLQRVINQWNNDNVGEDWKDGGMGESFYNRHKERIPLIKFLSSEKKELIGMPVGWNYSNGYYNYSWMLLLPDGSLVLVSLINGNFSVRLLGVGNGDTYTKKEIDDKFSKINTKLEEIETGNGENEVVRFGGFIEGDITTMSQSSINKPNTSEVLFSSSKKCFVVNIKGNYYLSWIGSDVYNNYDEGAKAHADKIYLHNDMCFIIDPSSKLLVSVVNEIDEDYINKLN